MKQIIIFSVFVALASAQFSCDSCDSAGNRQARTGCRIFCYGALGGNAVTRASLLEALDRDKDTDAGTTRPRFIQLQAENIGLCEGEASTVFDGIATVADGNPDLIQSSDINYALDLLEFLTGITAIDKETFLFAYDIGYANFGDDNCSTG